MIDSRTPRRSGGTAVGIEAGATIAHEHLDALAGELGINGDRRLAGELGGVEHRLARGRKDSVAALLERAVADGHDLDRAAHRRLHLGGRRVQGAGERVAGLARVAAGQPAAQLALLAAGKRRHLLGVLRAALDQRERLQHRVVQVRPHVGALLGANALGALGREAARQAPPGGSEDQGDRDQHGERREHRLARGPHRAVGPQEGEPAGEHQRDAEPAAAHLGSAERAHALRSARALAGRRARRLGRAMGGPAAPAPGATAGARQINSAPSTATAAGHTIASPGQGPAARTNSRPLRPAGLCRSRS